MKLYIETERLLLREWTPNDLPTFIKMNQDPEVMEFFPKILDSKESIDFYQRICKEFRESSMQTRSVQKFFFRKISLCIIKTIILYIKNRPYYEI